MTKSWMTKNDRTDNMAMARSQRDPETLSISEALTLYADGQTWVPQDMIVALLDRLEAGR